MDTRQIRYFLAIARCGSFTTAAERVGVAQPALSAQIAKLEAELGCKIFERRSRGVSLTIAGKCLLAHASEISERIEAARRETMLVGRSHRAELTVGLPPFTSMVLTVPLIEAARDRLPWITLRIVEGMGGTLRDWLAEGRVDLAVVYSVPNDELPNAVPILEEDLYVAALDGSGFSFGPEVTIAELASIPLVVSTARNSHRRLIDELAQRQGVSLTIRAEVDSIPGQRNLMLSGAGALVIPLAGLADWPIGGLRLGRLCGEDLVVSPQLVSARPPMKEPAVRAARELILALVDELVEAGKWRGARRCPRDDTSTRLALVKAAGAVSQSGAAGDH